MRDKHIQIQQDSELLKLLNRRVDEGVLVNKPMFYLLLGLKLVVYLGLSVVLYYSLYQIVEPVYFIICYILYGFISLLFAFNFAHDFSHNTIFKNKQLNHWAYAFIYTIKGAHAEAWKSRHIHSHHYAPNVEEYDSDLKITRLIRVTPSSEKRWYHRFQHIYAPFAYTTYSLFWVFIKDFVILYSQDEFTDKKEKGFLYHLSFWVQKIVYISYILAFPLLFAKQQWYVVIIGFLCMHLTQSLFLLFTFFMTHHVESTSYPTTDEQGYINTSWVMNQIRSSNDMHPFSQWANFVLGGFNNHIAHHLFPHYHHIHYPAINKIVYQVLRENDIEPNQTTYWGGVMSHLRLLKKMGQPDYVMSVEKT
jgi:linoleoyl-CoA desaturase